MIVVDSSALIAILQYEPERAVFFDAISKAKKRFVSAVTYQETSQVIFSRLGTSGLQTLDGLLNAIRAEIIPHDEALARLAVDAFRRYGKGIDPKARLNFGDCAVYALSQQTGAPLLFKGNDFAATDVAPCLTPDAP